nr:protein FP25 [Cydia pomonella granulovirus]WOZ30467.1 protein FP25 [Cydia pomonella granulovirus]WOZ30599.1 protein FP25 [Cydia pomonella granulovirus]WOZ45237.1 protein FP25 [Cydia pomonella granulovirus]WOZ45368.1 protein FP25 [Cydia pomonella granulovirus]
MQHQRPSQYYDIDECVEIFGLGEWEEWRECLMLLCTALSLNYDDIEHYTVKRNGLLVKLVDERTVNEWERKSREKRLRLSDLKKLSDGIGNVNNVDGDDKVKVFAAAPTKFKLLLHTVRKTLPNFKYIWIGKRGVMARHRSRSQIHVIKNETDIDYIKSYY